VLAALAAVSRALGCGAGGLAAATGWWISRSTLPIFISMRFSGFALPPTGLEATLSGLISEGLVVPPGPISTTFTLEAACSKYAPTGSDAAGSGSRSSIDRGFSVIPACIASDAVEATMVDEWWPGESACPEASVDSTLSSVFLRAKSGCMAASSRGGSITTFEVVADTLLCVELPVIELSISRDRPSTGVDDGTPLSEEIFSTSVARLAMW
jgi:hypothetical protein